MIKNHKLWSDFEKEIISQEDLSLEEKFALLDALFAEAFELGVFPLSNPLEGIEVDIKLARSINALSKTSKEDSF